MMIRFGGGGPGVIRSAKPVRPSRDTLNRLLLLARPYSGRLLLALVCMTFSSLASLAMPWLVQRLIDSITTAGSGISLSEVALLLVGSFFLQTLFGIVQSYQMSYAGERLVADLRRRIFSHLQTLSLGFYDNQRVGELTSRLSNDVTYVQNGLTSNIITVIPQAITLVGGLAIILITNWRMLIVAVAAIPVMVVVSRLFGQRLRRTSTASQAALGVATTVLEETLSSPRIVKAFGREGYEIGRYGAAVEESFRLAMQRSRLRAVFGPLIGVVGFSAVAGVLWFGGQEVLAGRLTTGQLVSQLLYMMMVAGPMGALAGVFAQLQEAAGAGQRVFELLDTPPSVAESPTARPLPEPVRGAVSFEDVFFAYTDGPEVLHGIDLNIAPGEVVALVGPSGAGKTTIASLIPRFYDPQGGRITIDGADLRDLTFASLRSNLAIVPQEPVLFGISVRENIAYGKLDATDAEIEAAAKAANAAGFIAGLSDGYNSIVGERGVKLSGGQRQRIAIARAILRDPRILILDEATSSLDNESEALVRAALERLMVGRTTLIIAHRLTTIERADRIVVLEGGSIVQQGSHAELLAQDGLYRRLYTRAAPAALNPAATPDEKDLEQLLTVMTEA